MGIEVTFSEDPGWVLAESSKFLASEPVLHNVVLTLLRERAANPEPGRYWVARDGSAIVGVVFQSPKDFFASLTSMSPEVIAAMVNEIVGAGVALPGVIGEASTAANFAGQWTERHAAAFPVEGQRIYELSEAPPERSARGRLRKASLDDRDPVHAWMRGFYADIGERGLESESIVERRLEDGQFWLWEDAGPAAMAANTEPVEGVVRVQAVYTPPDKRNRGYAGACVGELSRRVYGSGHRCILYTELGDPTSNSIYRRIGYRAVCEALKYRFE